MKKKTKDQKTPVKGSDNKQGNTHTRRNFFTKAAEVASEWTGSTQAFIGAVAVIVIWAMTGPVFGYSDTWQIVINTATTIVTFLLVFLIQHSQNRDTRAIHLKLDELIRCTEGAHTVMLDLEKLNDDELKQIHCRYQDLAEEARKRMRQGIKDTGVIQIDMEKKK